VLLKSHTSLPVDMWHLEVVETSGTFIFCTTAKMLVLHKTIGIFILYIYPVI
jgi:hypothetical protein